ncbi:unnamed protein product [Calypogeia fissa]
MQPPPPPPVKPGAPESPFAQAPPTAAAGGPVQTAAKQPYPPLPPFALQEWMQQQQQPGLGQQPSRPQLGNFPGPPKGFVPASGPTPTGPPPSRPQSGNFASVPGTPTQSVILNSNPASPRAFGGPALNSGPGSVRPGGPPMAFNPVQPFPSTAPLSGRPSGPPPGPFAGQQRPPGPPPTAAAASPGMRPAAAPPTSFPGGPIPQGKGYAAPQSGVGFAPPPSGAQQGPPPAGNQAPAFGPPPIAGQQRMAPYNALSQIPSSAPLPGHPNGVAQPPPSPGGDRYGIPSAAHPYPNFVQAPPGHAYGASQPAAPPQFGGPQATPYGAPPQGAYGTAQPNSTLGQPQAGQMGGYMGPPPIGGYGNDPTARGLPEEFQSLSMVPLPGSMDAGVDAAALPRPSDDMEPPPSTWAANCHPRYLRLTCNSLPNSHSLVSRWHLPLGAVLHPLAEAPPGEEVPVVNFGATSIVRCRRCRTYINAYVTFTDGGRRWRCNVCVLLNEVPVEYFCPLDANGKRRDAEERPELSKGSVEFVASTEYMVRPPMPPVYFFLIDVSLSAIRTGMLQVACETIKASLDKLPGFPRTQIGFITFDSTLHFYSLKSSLTQPQMMVVAELDDPFLPMPDDLLVNLSESRTVVEALLDSLPSMFQNNINIESALGPALKASFMVMSQLGGKLLVFQSTLPSLGVGRLKLRGDDPRVYGTEKEASIRVTDEQFYKQMAADFSKYQIGVNIYAFADKYTDIASLGTLPKYTGGQIIYYPGYYSELHSKKFSYELARDLSRETAWEAVIRIRCGKGIRFSTYHGHFMLRSSDLLALPAVDVDKTFAMQLTLEDTLLTSPTVYFQVAVLYTSSSGERRIRVHTMAAPVTADLGEMYRSADVGAITSIMSRLAIEKSLVSKLEDARQATQARLVKSLREYRNLFAVQHRTAGRLIFPESLRLLPLYVLGINKSLALRGGFNDVSADERSAAAFEMQIMPISRLLKFLYPSLYRFDDFLYQGAKIKPDGPIELPSPLPLTGERLDPRGAYFLNDGMHFVLWVGKVLPLDFVGLLYGSEVAQSADSSKVAVIPQNNDLSKRFVAVLQNLREKNSSLYQECYLVRQGEQPRESRLVLTNLVEDRTAPPFGYVDWVIQIHRQVQQNS